MKLGRNICHLSTVMYCKAKRGGAYLKSIGSLSVMNIMHFEKQQFSEKQTAWFSGTIRILSFFIALKSYFLEFTDCNDRDAYAVIVHIRLLLKAELTSAISQK